MRVSSSTGRDSGSGRNSDRNSSNIDNIAQWRLQGCSLHVGCNINLAHEGNKGNLPVIVIFIIGVIHITHSVKCLFCTISTSSLSICFILVTTMVGALFGVGALLGAGGAAACTAGTGASMAGVGLLTTWTLRVALFRAGTGAFSEGWAAAALWVGGAWALLAEAWLMARALLQLQQGSSWNHMSISGHQNGSIDYTQNIDVGIVVIHIGRKVKFHFEKETNKRLFLSEYLNGVLWVEGKETPGQSKCVFTKQANLFHWDSFL